MNSTVYQLYTVLAKQVVLLANAMTCTNSKPTCPILSIKL